MLTPLEPRKVFMSVPDEEKSCSSCVYSSSVMAFNFKTKLNSQKTNYNMYFTGCLLTNNTADNLCDMTQAVVDGLTSPEYPNGTIHLKTDFETYMKQQLGK